jgi:hypothetical protein
MNWKRLLLDVLLYATVLFAVITWGHVSQDFIKNAVEAVGLALGFVGSNDLRRGEHRKIHPGLVDFIIILLASIPILALLTTIPALAFTKAVQHVVLEIAFYSWFAIIAAIFPLSLYLNRKQNKFTSQPTIDNAS